MFPGVSDALRMSLPGWVFVASIYCDSAGALHSGGRRLGGWAFQSAPRPTGNIWADQAQSIQMRNGQLIDGRRPGPEILKAPPCLQVTRAADVVPVSGDVLVRCRRLTSVMSWASILAVGFVARCDSVGISSRRGSSLPGQGVGCKVCSPALRPTPWAGSRLGAPGGGHRCPHFISGAVPGAGRARDMASLEFWSDRVPDEV